TVRVGGPVTALNWWLVVRVTRKSVTPGGVSCLEPVNPEKDQLSVAKVECTTCRACLGVPSNSAGLKFFHFESSSSSLQSGRSPEAPPGLQRRTRVYCHDSLALPNLFAVA